MKKIFIAMLAALTALFCLAGCGSKFVGEWELSKVKKGDETIKAKDFKEAYGFDISKAMQIEIEKDGTGTMTTNDGDDKDSEDFEWEEDDNKITLEFEKKFKGAKKMKGKLKDDELVITFDDDDDDVTYYFSHDGESDDEDDDDDDDGGHVSKAKLKSANSNAKVIFTAIERESCDIIADGGDLSQIKSLPHPMKVSELDTSNKVQNAVYDAMKDYGCSDDSYVYWEIDGNYNAAFAQYSEDNVVGQYPDCETDPSAEHSIGYRF